MNRWPYLLPDLPNRNLSCDTDPMNSELKPARKISLPPACTGLILLAGLAGILEVVWTSQWGIPVSPDGLVYLSAAQSFADGFGFLNHPQPDGLPVLHYPPLYPFLVSLLLMGGVNLNLAPALLNAVFFFLFLVSLGWILFRLTKSPFAGVIGAWIGWLGPGIYPWFAYPWSEPLFLLTSLWGLYFLACYLASGRLRPLLAAGFLLGMAYLTRYIGSSLWITGVISILLLPARPFKTRFYGMTVFALLAGSPMGFWLIRNWLLTGGLTDRVKSFHPKSFNKLFEITLTFQPWLGVGHGGFPSFRSIWFSLFLMTTILFFWTKWVHPSQSTQAPLGRQPLRTSALFTGAVILTAFFLSLNVPNADPFIFLGKWFLGRDTSLYLLESLPVLCTLLLILVFAVSNLRTSHSPPEDHEKVTYFFLKINFLYATLFFILIIVSMTWFDNKTRFLPRILSPWFLTGLMLVVIAAARFFTKRSKASLHQNFFRYLAPAAILIMLVSYSLTKLTWWDNALNVGLGDINREWRVSSFAPPINLPGKPATVYSNFPVAYYLLTGEKIQFRSMMRPPSNPDSENILFVHLPLFELKPKPGSDVHWQWIYKDDKSIWFVPRKSIPTP